MINKNIEANDILYEEVSITIPDGVTVLYISSHAESSEGYDDYVTVEIKNLSNQKSGVIDQRVLISMINGMSE